MILSFADSLSHAEALSPPPGLRLDAAVAATYSLDFLSLFEAIIHLARIETSPGLEPGGGQRAGPDKVAALAAATKLAEDVTVFAQKGRLSHRGPVPSAILPLLEPMIIYAAAPASSSEENKRSWFHPKFWLMRFEPIDPGGGEASWRLLVSSKNLTGHRSLDLTVRLEGGEKLKAPAKEAARLKALNLPLAKLVERLPGLNVGNGIDIARAQKIRKLASGCLNVSWDLPEGFDNLRFHPHGIGEGAWKTDEKRDFIAISPFCSKDSLKKMASENLTAKALITNPATFKELAPETLGLFRKNLFLSGKLEDYLLEGALEDGDLTAPIPARSASLHAKAYIFESGGRLEIVAGSANATDAGLSGSRNVELLISISGPVSKLGSLDDILGPEGLGDFLEDADPRNLQGDQDQLDDEAARKAADGAQEAMAEASLLLACHRNENLGLYNLALEGALPPLPDEITEVLAFPATLRPDDAASLDFETLAWSSRGPADRGAPKGARVPIPNGGGVSKTGKDSRSGQASKAGQISSSGENARPGPLPSGRAREKPSKNPLPLAAWLNMKNELLTAFVAFKVLTTRENVSASFVLKLPTTGFPSRRGRAASLAVLKEPGDVVRYLRYFLSDYSPDAGAGLPGQKTEGGGRGSSRLSPGSDLPGLLELLAITFSRHPKRLEDALAFIEPLGSEGIGSDILALKDIFQKALKALKTEPKAGGANLRASDA